MEYNFEGRELSHLPVWLDFKNGKLYPNDRLGVEPDMSKLTQIMEVSKYDTNRANLLPPRRLHHKLVVGGERSRKTSENTSLGKARWSGLRL